MYLLRYIPILLSSIVLLMSGCGRDEVATTLDRAELLQDEYPDSALDLLESIDADRLRPNSESEARYGLLITRANAINHTNDTTDTLISKAAKYFEDNRRKEYAVKSYFYKAQILLLTEDYSGAMENALKSLEWNEKTGNRRFLAKTYDLIGSVYSNVYNYPQAAAYFRKAAGIFHELGRSENELFSRLSEAKAYSQDDFMEERSVELLDSLSGNFPEADSIPLGFLHHMYIYPLSLLGRHNEAYGHYRKALGYWHGVNLMESKPLVADMFTNVCMYDSARHYLAMERIENPDYDNDVNYHFAMCNLADSLGDTPLYYEELRKMTEWERGNVRGAMRDEISLIERDYHRDRAERERLRSVRNRLIYIFLTVIVIIVGVCAFIFYRLRNRLRMEELLRNEEKAKRDRDDAVGRMEAMMVETARLKESISANVDKSIRMPLNALDSLCDEYFRLRGESESGETDALSEVRFKTMMRTFRQEVDRMKSPECVAQLQTALDADNGGVLRKLREQIPSLKERDIQMLTYILAGFSMRSVCLLCDIKEGNYYNRWYRLKQRIEKSGAADVALFKSVINRTPSGRAMSAG